MLFDPFWMCHLQAGVEHGSHGELADGLVSLTDADRAGLEAGEPLVLRFAVSNDATHPGGLCLFGANTGELPLDPTLEIRTRDPLPTDLGVDPNAKVAVPADLDSKVSDRRHQPVFAQPGESRSRNRSPLPVKSQWG